MKNPDSVLLSFRVVERHSYLRAVADLSLKGLTLRGLKLEETSTGELVVKFPGRKIQGQWQTVFETNDDNVERLIHTLLTEAYTRRLSA